jgi:DNA repair exonuclease SbcCD ATPase subunit
MCNFYYLVKNTVIIKKYLHLKNTVVRNAPQDRDITSPISRVRRRDMKKIAILTMLTCLVMVTGVISGFAQELGSQIGVLEQKASRLQAQIDQAKQQNASAVDQRLQALNGSVEQLVRQRVSLDSQIAQLEGQIQEMKSSSTTNLNRQVAQYDQELAQVRQQIVGLKSKQAAEAAQKFAQPATMGANPAAQSATEPAAAPCPSCPPAK